MAIVGFNFMKILVEKKEMAKGKVNISNNVSIKDIGKTDLSLGAAKQDGLKIDFQFKTVYEPSLGTIELEGNVLYMATTEQAKEILTGWKKDKTVPKDIMSQILNTVLQRCNIEALLLSKEMNLPPPIPMPRVNVDQKGTSAKAEAPAEKK